LTHLNTGVNLNLYTLVYTNMSDIIRLSISEASRLFGVNAQTIRRGIRQQEISYSVVRNRYQLNFESVLKWSQRRTTIQNKLAKNGIGQYVDKWKIKNPLYSPNPKVIPTTSNKTGTTHPPTK